jgi:hypothetical protein
MKTGVLPMKTTLGMVGLNNHLANLLYSRIYETPNLPRWYMGGNAALSPYGFALRTQ